MRHGSRSSAAAPNDSPSHGKLATAPRPSIRGRKILFARRSANRAHGGGAFQVAVSSDTISSSGNRLERHMPAPSRAWRRSGRHHFSKARQVGSDPHDQTGPAGGPISFRTATNHLPEKAIHRKSDSCSELRHTSKFRHSALALCRRRHGPGVP
jgi:hypothetical protein